MNAFWILWGVTVAAGLILIAYDTQATPYDKASELFWFPSRQMMIGMLVLVADVFIAIGFALAGVVS